MTDHTNPDPIRKSILPTTPPSEFEFATVLGGDAGCLLWPGDTGSVVVRRRVTYGDWEPVRPDRWADEPESAGCAASVGSAPAADRAALRDRIAEALYPTYGQQDRNRSLAIADAVLAVLPAPADQTATRGAVLREAAAAIEAWQAREEATAWAQSDEPDPEIEVEGAAVRAASALLRRMADETQPTTVEAPHADRVVAYVLGTHTDLHCLRCAPPPLGDIWTPVTAEELEDGGVCARCGVDVLIPQPAAGARQDGAQQ